MRENYSKVQAQQTANSVSAPTDKTRGIFWMGVSSGKLSAYLDDSVVVPPVVARPRCAVPHLPAVGWRVLGSGNQSVHADLELLILALQNINRKQD
jgi:hypothetical protein